MLSLGKYMYEEFKRLCNWRFYASLVAKAAARVLSVEFEVYVFGGAAENRLTALSDLDVAVVLREDPSPEARLRIKLMIMKEAFRLGLPWDYPLDLHVVGPSDFKRIRKYSSVVRIK